MKTSEVHECCNLCGTLARMAHCNAYGKMLPISIVSTYHNGICPLCGREMAITELRDFGYPDLTLINWRSMRRAIKEAEQEKI